MGMEVTHSPYAMTSKFFLSRKKNAAEPKLRGESKPSKKLNPWLNLE